MDAPCYVQGIGVLLLLRTPALQGRRCSAGWEPEGQTREN